MDDIDRLIRELGSHDPHARFLATELLIDQGQRAVPGLILALRSRTWLVRWHSVTALGEIGSGISIPGLHEALRDDIEDIRWNAAWALGKMKRKASLTVLERALSDPCEDVRWNATWAIGKIGGPHASRALERALMDESANVKDCAQLAVRRMRRNRDGAKTAIRINRPPTCHSVRVPGC